MGDAAAHLLEHARHQRGRPAHRHLGAQLGQRPNIRARNPAVEDIAQDGHFQPRKAPLLLANGEGVQQRLGGVLMRAVARIDDAGVEDARKEMRRAGGAVADHDEVNVQRLQVARGVLEGLALPQRGSLGGEVDDVRRKSLLGQLEARAGAGGRLDEQVDDGLAAQRRHLFDRALAHRLEGQRGVQHGGDLRGRQRFNVQQMLAIPAHTGFSSTTSSAPPVSASRTRTLSARAVGTFLPTKSALMGSSRCPRSISTAS